ncbi:MAG: Gfo/Idh/MocA family oxidoreductase [Candidatus Aminicenantes bacterium]
MKERVGIGIIGLGKMGILHSALINTIPQAELISVHDTNQKLAKYVQKTGLDVAFYSNLDRMLEDSDIQAVFICTPPFTHFPIAQKCIEKNMDLFVEKPLAESFDSAKRMVSLLKSGEVVHSVGFTLAHVPIYQRAKEILEKKPLGKLFRFNVSIYISQVFSKKKGWFFDKRKSGGGVIIDIASHLLYLLTSYFGPPKRMYARLKSFFSEVEDSGSVVFDYEDGLTGVLDTSWSLPGYRTSSTTVTIEGDNGVMEITNDFIKLHLTDATPDYERGWTTFHKIDVGSQSHFELGGEGFADEDMHFLRCCIDRAKPRVSWYEGLEVQRIIEAIYRSDEANEPCLLDSIR